MTDPILHLAQAAEKETRLLMTVLPRVLEVQWDRSPASRRPRDESGIRAPGSISDPTADTALDPNRLYLRTVLARAEPHLVESLTRIRGVRRGLELALIRWEGDDEPDVASPSEA